MSPLLERNISTDKVKKPTDLFMLEMCIRDRFRRGDIGGMSYSITNNIVNYLIVIATLSGVLGWPDKIVYGYVIPGMSIGLLCSGIYYAYMGRRLSKKEGRADVTALPSGVSTPAMFVILYGVIMPLHYALEDPMLAWSAACLLYTSRCV